MKIIADAKVVDGRLKVGIDLRIPESDLDLDEKKGGGKPGRGGAGRWVTIMGRHVFIGGDGIPRQGGPNGPKVDMDELEGRGESKPKPEEKPKPVQREKPSAAAGGRITVKMSAPSQKEQAEIGKVVAEWGGGGRSARSVIGMDAVNHWRLGDPGIVAKDGSEVVGVASYRIYEGEKELALGYVATARKGYGTQMIAEASRLASEKGLTLGLHADITAKTFYEQIGMKEKPKGSQRFYFNQKQAAAFHEKYKESLKSVKESEPEEPGNCVFADGYVDRDESALA